MIIREPEPDAAPAPDPSTNPDPSTTTGLEPGTGVPPGETPPGEASATAGLGGPRQSVPTGRSSSFVVFAVALGVVILLIVVGIAARAADLF